MTLSAKWWTLMITSVIPKARRRERVISSRVRPAISTRALGRVSVRGFRRVPRPAARIMAFIAGPSSKTLKSKRDSSHPQADPFAGAKGEEEIGLLRSE